MKILFLWLSALITGSCLAQDSTAWYLKDTLQYTIATDSGEYHPPADSSRIDVRKFDDATLKDLRDDNDLDYRQPPSVAESLWERFLAWLAEFLQTLMTGAMETDWGRVFLYTLGLIVLVVVIMMVLKVDAFRVFYNSSDTGAPVGGTLTENIHEMNFDLLIQEATSSKDFRMGIRLLFLFSLKLLADKHLVDWKPGKTNHDYLHELSVSELKTGFNELSFYFDYAWYGEFAVSENMFQRVHQIFEDWRRQIR